MNCVEPIPVGCLRKFVVTSIGSSSSAWRKSEVVGTIRAVELAHDLEAFCMEIWFRLDLRVFSIDYGVKYIGIERRSSLDAPLSEYWSWRTVVSIRQAIIARKAEVSAKEGWVQAETQRRNAQNINDFMREVLGTPRQDRKGQVFCSSTLLRWLQ